MINPKCSFVIEGLVVRHFPSKQIPTFPSEVVHSIVSLHVLATSFINTETQHKTNTQFHLLKKRNKIYKYNFMVGYLEEYSIIIIFFRKRITNVVCSNHSQARCTLYHTM